MRAGIPRNRIVVDPGIGFAKTAAQSLQLLQRLPELGTLGCHILVGVSRKSFLGAITGEQDPRRRLPASLAAGLFALSGGAAILRVHDVPETVQAVKVWQALTERVLPLPRPHRLHQVRHPRRNESMTRARHLFGTDGIRGTANTDPMTAEMALRLGQAAGLLFTRGNHRHRVVIGKDTRLSGYMIEPALTAGFIGAGMDVTLVGPLPTPAIAMLTRSLRADLGVMISASHNPFEDNGIKLFGPDGFKLDRRHRGRDRGADGERHAPAPGCPRRTGPRRTSGRRRRPLHRGRQGELPARSATGRAEDRGRLRARRRLSRRAYRAMGTGCHGHPCRRLAGWIQHQPRLRLHRARVSLRPGGRTRRASGHRAGRRRGPAADRGRNGRTDRRRPDPGADRTLVGGRRATAR